MSVKELIFHIGLHKTGTTSIQHFLYENREIILNQYGIYYAETFGLENHYIYLFAFGNKYPEYIREDKRLSFTELSGILVEKLQKTKPIKVLFSAEDFTYYAYNQVKADVMIKLIELIKPEKVLIICYLRRQDRQIESWYSELSKNYDFINIIPKTVLHTGYLDLNYFNFLNELELFLRNSYKGVITILPRIYKRDFNKEWDAVEDFCEAIGIGKSELVDHKIETNISLSPTSVEALKRLKESMWFLGEFSQK
jgi:hypothetical protein